MALTYTRHIDNILDQDEGYKLYFSLVDTIPWQDSIKTRHGGFTRKGYSIEFGRHSELDHAILTSLLNFGISKDKVLGVYLNYYQDGDMYCPNHSHKGTRQIVISLGATRTLNVSNKSYNMQHGSAIIFGSSMHGVPREPGIKDGRISIALFIEK